MLEQAIHKRAVVYEQILSKASPTSTPPSAGASPSLAPASQAKAGAQRPPRAPRSASSTPSRRPRDGTPTSHHYYHLEAAATPTATRRRTSPGSKRSPTTSAGWLQSPGSAAASVSKRGSLSRETNPVARLRQIKALSADLLDLETTLTQQALGSTTPAAATTPPATPSQGTDGRPDELLAQISRVRLAVHKLQVSISPQQPQSPQPPQHQPLPHQQPPLPPLSATALASPIPAAERTLDLSDMLSPVPVDLPSTPAADSAVTVDLRARIDGAALASSATPPPAPASAPAPTTAGDPTATVQNAGWAAGDGGAVEAGHVPDFADLSDIKARLGRVTRFLNGEEPVPTEAP